MQSWPLTFVILQRSQKIIERDFTLFKDVTQSRALDRPMRGHRDLKSTKGFVFTVAAAGDRIQGEADGLALHRHKQDLATEE
jgi:hypothetical protein